MLSNLIKKSAAPALLLAFVPALAVAQSDDFSHSDSQWTRQDPVYEASTAYGLGLGPQVTFSFPASGGYHIHTEPSPMPELLGQGRGGALRQDVIYNESFYVAADLLSWNDTTQLVASVMARISDPGPGSTSGYLFGYSTPGPGQSQGVAGIYQLVGELYTPLAVSSIRLYPTNAYRLAFFAQGSDLEGRIYLLPNTNTPLISLSANDWSWSSGYSGLAQADQSAAMEATTDVTYGHYRATDFWICDQPQSVFFLPGGTVTLSASAVGPAPLGYQWTHYGTNLTDGGAVSGATTPTLTLNNVTAADAGPYAVVVTDGSTPARSATSVAATVSLLTHGSPDVIVDFENGIPAGTSSRGSAHVDTDNATGHALHLTDAVNSQQGSFVVGDLDHGAVVRGFDVQFDALIGGSTSDPSGPHADGLSFTWTTDLPAGSFGEGGSDAGLTLIFEVYNNNSSIPGPAINVKYQGVIVASQPLPLSVLETYPNFVPVNIRLSPGGLLTVVCNSEFVWNNLPIPGLAGGLAGASFGWGARTGSYNDNFWIDNVRLITNPQIVSLSHTTNPAGVSIAYSGVLQSATNVAGPYTDVPQAASPYSFSFPAGAGQMFWRARSP
jgi:hypothetical protein